MVQVCCRPVVVVWVAAFLIGAPCAVLAQASSDDPNAQAHALRQIIAAMEVEAAELEPRLEDARQQLADLNRQVDETTALLEQDRSRLETLREEERQLDAAIAAAKTEQDRRQANAASELDRVTAELDKAKAELAQVTGQLDRRRATEAAQAARLEALELRIATATTRLEEEIPARQADLDGQVANLRSELARLTEQRAALQAELARSEDLSRRIDAQETRSRALADEIGTLTAELAALARVRDAAAEPPPDLPSATPPTVAPSSAASTTAATEASPSTAAAIDPPRQRRDAARVNAVLATTPGLPGSPQMRGRLRDLLVDGQCAIDALRQVQDPINRQSLLVIVDQLGGC